MIDTIEPDFIVKDLCNVFCIKVSDLVSRRKTNSLATYRQIYYYITTFFDKSQMNIKMISEAINKDHTLIIKQRRTIIDLIEVKDTAFMEALKVYQVKSFVYTKVKQYYESQGKTMNYEKAFEAIHYQRAK